MCAERAVFVLAGSLILLSVVLSILVSPWWLLLATFVGLNMFQAGFTGFCLAEIIFRKLGLKSRCAVAA